MPAEGGLRVGSGVPVQVPHPRGLADAVPGHLQAILASDAFRRSPHAAALLRYLVERAIAKSAPKEKAPG